MKVNDYQIYERADKILKSLFGYNAEFRDGQYEAIEATILHNRTLVVQRTGWGKSLVYFICTKLLRENGKGVTFVISPLLTLMNNQHEAAEKMGLKCGVLNSTTKELRSETINAMINGELDLAFITPETLFADEIQVALNSINIDLFVIDEAHCISDWGHDFRLDYCNIYKVLNIIPKSVPVLGTTATANNRVIMDLKKQLGGDVFISRGPLLRKNLSIQVLKLANSAERYAWILENISKLSGSGIIYCLTQRDCDHLAGFLNKNNINVRTYYARNEDSEYLNTEAEQLFKENQIKALVATVKLGMGYDKGDVAFIIHYQQPASVVAYYQQIGRAGRNLDRAYTFLMCGKEDKNIQDYFINTAFPTKEEAEQVVNIIFENTDRGIGLYGIMSKINIKLGRLEKALAFLKNEGFIVKEKSRYYSALKKFEYNQAHYEAVTAVRQREQQQMQEMTETKECYSKFVVNRLDDNTDETCGICPNCLGYNEFPVKASEKYINIALDYLEHLIIPIEPRKKWAATAYTKMTEIEFQNETGICPSKYGDPGYGTLVKNGKYPMPTRFSDELVKKSESILKPVIAENSIDAITCVPSLRSNLVEDFTERLAEKCEVKFIKLLKKSDAKQQKTMQNSSYQCENALKSFDIIDNMNDKMPHRVLLVDDIVDSKWTLTVCGYLLMKSGCEKVYPFALADSSQKEE